MTLHSAMVYGIFYFIMVAVVYLWSVLIKRRNVFASVLLGALISFFVAYFSAVRYGIGTDYFLYAKWFLLTAHHYTVNNLEPGYLLLSSLTAALGGNVHTLFFIVSYISTVFLLLTLYNYREKINVAFAFFIYLFWFYQTSFNSVRQSLAIVIALFATQFVFQRKFWLFILFVVLAMMFHATAVIVVPLYFIFNFTRHKSLAIIFSSVFIIAVILLCNINWILAQVLTITDSIKWMNKYSVYLDNSSSVPFSWILFFSRAFIVLLAVLFSRRMVRDDGRVKLFVIYAILDLVFENLVYINTWTFRFSSYFYIADVLLIPYFSRVFTPKSRFFFNIAASVLVIAYWANVFILKGNDGTVPYVTIWGH